MANFEMIWSGDEITPADMAAKSSAGGLPALPCGHTPAPPKTGRSDGNMPHSRRTESARCSDGVEVGNNPYRQTHAKEK